MKFWLLSDLHVDVAPYVPGPTPPGAEAIVVAGDICSRLCKRSLPWLADNLMDRGLPLVFVPGNHDFYGVNLTTEIEKAHPLAREMGIHLLARGESVVLSDTRVIGGTLWTDYRASGDPLASRNEAAQRMNCHRKIRHGADYRRFSPNEAAREHAACLGSIEAELAKPWQGPTMVVTHHAPTLLSLPNGEARTPIDGAYASDLDWLMERYRPDFWIHGHIHENRDLDLHGTRVVGNPRGYEIRTGFGPKERVEIENPHHNPALVLDSADPWPDRKPLQEPGAGGDPREDPSFEP